MGPKAYLGIVHLQKQEVYWISGSVFPDPKFILDSHNGLHNLRGSVCVSTAHSFTCNFVGDDRRQTELPVGSEYLVECFQDCLLAILPVLEMVAHHRSKCFNGKLKRS